MRMKSNLLGIGLLIFVLILSISITSAVGSTSAVGNGGQGAISKANTKAMGTSTTAKITGVYFGKYTNLVITPNGGPTPYSLNPVETTLNQGALPTVLINFANLPTGGVVKFDWLDKSNKIINTYSYTIPSPGLSHWLWYSVSNWCPSTLSAGQYNVKITTPWGTKTQAFTILPAGNYHSVNDLHISDQGLQFIANWEGHGPMKDGRYLMYNSNGDATIGYGHLIHYGKINGKEDPKYIKGLTPDEALDLLRSDAVDAENRVKRDVKVQVTQYQFDALESISFNSGYLVNVPGAPLLTDLNAGKYSAAATDITKYKITSHNVPLLGLKKRRAAESAMFANADYSGKP